MAEFKIDGRMKVKTLQTKFKKEFGATLRVYHGVNFANEELTLAAIRVGDTKGGEFACRGNMQVGTFEKKMKELFGIRVKVADKANEKLAPADATITSAGK